MSFTTAHFHVTTAQFVINCTLKYALLCNCIVYEPYVIYCQSLYTPWGLRRVTSKDVFNNHTGQSNIQHFNQ